MKVEVNVYYDPEKSGLEIFKFIDTAGSYEFDMFVIWKKKDDGRLFYATDSGCSCPTPFENCYEIDEITNETLYNFEQALQNHYNISTSDVMNITKSVKDHLRNFEKTVNSAKEFFA